MPGTDGIQKQWSKRHGAAVKQGIKKAKARKRVVKQATLALRKAPSKQAIVQRLFTPKPPAPPGGAAAGKTADCPIERATVRRLRAFLRRWLAQVDDVRTHRA